MVEALVSSYLVNTAYTLLKVGMFGFFTWFAFKLIDKFSRVDILKQLKEEKLGAWIFWSALIIALAILLGQL